MIQIGLLWHSFKSGNLGVGALSICNLKLIDDELKLVGVDAKFLVIGNSGECSYVPEEYKNRVEFVHFSAAKFLRSPFSIVRKIASCDVVFDIGEGDSFSDIYGLPRLLKMSVGKIVALAAGKRLILSPQTIGPFSTSVGKALGVFLMRRAHSVVARDHMSRSVLEQLGINNSYEAIDVAFALPFARGGGAPEGGKAKFGLNVSSLLYNGGYDGANQFGLACDYKAFTNRLIEFLLKDPAVEIHLIPHVLTPEYPVEDDYKVCMLLKSMYPSVVLPERFKSPSEAKGYISGMDFFAGARMHATIGAFSSGVAVAPLAYSRKFAGLFESIGYKRVLDMKALGEDELVSLVVNSFKDRDSLKDEVLVGLDQVEKKMSVYKSVIRHALPF